MSDKVQIKIRLFTRTEILIYLGSLRHGSNQQIIYSFCSSNGNNTRKSQFHQVLFRENIYSYEFLIKTSFRREGTTLQP